MAAGIDQIRTRESDGRGTPSRETTTDSAPTDDTRLVRVDVSGVSIAAVESIVRDRGAPPVYVEHRAGNTYLVADRDPTVA